MTKTYIHRIGSQALLAIALTILPLGFTAHAQDSAPSQEKSAQDSSASTPKAKSREEYMAPYRIPSVESTHMIYLNNVTSQNDSNEIMVALRNMLYPGMKLYLVASQNAIAIEGPPDQVALAGKIVKDLDRTHKTYRLTYTFTETDSGKRIGVEHYSVVAVDGQRTSLKQGSKVPVVTGQYDDGKNGAQEQFTYLDIGINIDSTIDQLANGLRLKSKVEQSSVAATQAILGAQEPIIRQSVLEGNFNITLGKPLALGQIDVPASTRHLDVEVVAELIP
jgi:type II secretory pathway component GspD/PulD (secretin)